MKVEKAKEINLPFLANLKVFGKFEEINVVESEETEVEDDLPF